MFKKVLLYSIFGSGLASILSLLIKTRISSSGFFSLYHGAPHDALGWPFIYLKLYVDENVVFEPKLFLLNTLFWFMLAVPSIALIITVMRITHRKA